MKRLKKLFTEHPASQGESYCEHAIFALDTAAHLFVSAVCLLIHAIFPFICPPVPFDLRSTKKFIDKKYDCRSDQASEKSDTENSTR